MVWDDRRIHPWGDSPHLKSVLRMDLHQAKLFLKNIFIMISIGFKKISCVNPTFIHCGTHIDKERAMQTKKQNRGSYYATSQ
jgi:hypothetical protein